MSKRINHGKRFEEDVQTSSQNQGVFIFRVRDVFIPPSLRMKMRTPKNKYDFIFYHSGYLFPSELKSTQGKSFSFDGTNPNIKEHQIEALIEDNKHDGVIPSLILNFREPENRTFFVHIEDFENYMKIASGEIAEHDLEGRINEKSLPLHIVEQIGIEITGVKKRVRYTYMIEDLFNGVIKNYE